jgi:hypothetical protein
VDFLIKAVPKSIFPTPHSESEEKWGPAIASPGCAAPHPGKGTASLCTPAFYLTWESPLFQVTVVDYLVSSALGWKFRETELMQ